jgi:type II secretory pathway component PulJ
MSARVAPGRRARARSGFTLFEVLGVVLVTALLLAAAISFFLNLTRQAVRATESTREVRRATALLDRIATDLEHTLLVKKPAEEDALAQPWLFLAESRYSQPGGELGSDQIKFIRREIPRSSDGPASDKAMVAYTLHRNDENENFELRRWSRSELGESLEREFPPADDPDSLVLADDLRYFALRFLDEGGEWKDRWDSTLVAESGELPVAVEIEVAIARPEGSVTDDADPDVEPTHYARAVELPLRPIDLEALLKTDEEKDGAAGEDEEGEGRTLAECVDLSKLPLGVGTAGLSESDVAALRAALENTPAAAFAPYAGALAGHPAVNPDCL